MNTPGLQNLTLEEFLAQREGETAFELVESRAIAIRQERSLMSVKTFLLLKLALLEVNTEIQLTRRE